MAEQQVILLPLLSLPFLLLFSLVFLFRLRRCSIKLPPSPPRIPIIGHFHRLGALPHRSLKALSQKYGPLMLLHFGSVPVLVVSSADMSMEISKTQDINFANRPVTTAAHTLLYGCTDVGFAPYGEYWRQVRKISVLQLLSVKRVQSFRFTREEEAALLIKKISHSCQLRSSVNLSEFLSILSHNLISRAAFSSKFEAEDDDSRHIGHLTREVMSLLGVFSVRDFFPYLGWIDTVTGLDGRLKRTSQELDKLLDQVIQHHQVGTTQRSKGDQRDGEDFLDILLQAQKDTTLDIPITRDNIKAIILDMFIGGSDTTAITVEWTMAELVRHPRVMRKVQEDVRSVVGKKSKVEEDDIRQMAYLKAVIKEILRLHPPAPLLIPRESIRATNVNDYHIPAKTRVFINVWAIQRDPNLLENPEEFIPERFINNPVDFQGRDFHFLPFGAGRRGCPGMQFGLASTELILANLLYWFDWELPGKSKLEELDIDEDFGLTVHKKTPLHLAPQFHFSK